ncbi:MAG: PKD domain-containing protein [Bacteroidota bacterium]
MKLFTINLKNCLALCLLGILLTGSAKAQQIKYALFSTFQVGTEAIFTDLSYATPPITEASRIWDFGDGTTSTAEHPAHIYASDGLYLVTLTVTWSDNTSQNYQISLNLDSSGNVYHEEHAVQKNSMSNIFDVLTNDGLPAASHNVTLTANPSFGTASVTAAKEISYTPNANYTGWDVLQYTACDLSGTVCDSGLVYIEVVDGACGYSMSLSHYFKDCPASRLCPQSPNWQYQSQPSPNPAGTQCFGYQFIFRNPTSETIDEMNAYIDIDPNMGIDVNSGRIYNGPIINPTPASVTVTPDAGHNRISFALESGQTIAPGEDFAYVFNVDVNAFPPGGAGSDYNTSLHGSAECVSGGGRTFNLTATDREGGACDPNEITVRPVGCGVWGDIDTTVKSLVYTVEFENRGIGPASEITVKDVLPQALDINSIRVLDGHPFAPEVVIIPPNNEVNFHFHDVHLPAAMSDSVAAQGHVTFSVDLKAGLPMGTPIDNWADIIFDTQLPVRTDTTFSTLFAAPAPRVDLGADIGLTDCDSCLTLTATTVGGSGNYSYEWTNGDSTSTSDVCPTDSMWVGVWVTDASTGCKDFDRINLDVNCVVLNVPTFEQTDAELTVFPNPTQSSTIFRIAVAKSETVTLEIFDGMGVKVADIFKGMAIAGSAIEIDFNAEDLTAGVYFYHLTHQNGDTQSGRLAVVK